MVEGVMETADLIMKKTGLTQEETALLLNRICSSSWINIENNQSTWTHNLEQKIDYFMNVLQLPAKSFVTFPKTLTISFSDLDFVEEANRRLNILTEHFGFTVDAIRRSPYILSYDCEKDSTCPTSVNQKLKFLQKFLGFGIKEINQIPTILGYSIEPNNTSGVVGKVNYFNKTLGFGKPQFKKAPQLLFLDCVNLDNPASVPNKIAFLAEHGLGAKQLKQSPQLLYLDCDKNSTSPTSLAHKFANLEKMGLTQKAIVAYPMLLGMDCDPDSTSPTSIAQKLNFYKENLGFNAKTVSSFPQLLGMDCDVNSKNPAAIINKFRYYENELGVSRVELAKYPNLLGLNCDKNSKDENSVPHKTDLIKECIGSPIYQQLPMILAMPHQCIKIRSMLYRLSNMDTLNPNASVFIQCEQKTYARLMHLRNNVTEYTTRAIIYPEHKFSKLFETDNTALMKEYPLDKQAILELCAEYSQLDNVPKIELSQEEIAQICKE